MTQTAAHPAIIGTAKEEADGGPVLYVAIPQQGGAPIVLTVAAGAYRVTTYGFLLFLDTNGNEVAAFAPGRWLYVATTLSAVTLL